MKKILLAATFLLSFVFGAFAQSDLQPLAVVKLNKSETITLKQLKTRIGMGQKMGDIPATLSIDDKKQILEALIDQRLVVQAAQKAGISITDSQVNQAFLQNISQMIGRQVTEAEFASYIKETTGLSLDDFMKQQVGLSLSEYKAFFKEQIMTQQYILQQKQSEIAKAVPKDEDIRKFYDLNKASFVQNDLVKVFMVRVPKNNNADGAKAKGEALLKGITNKSLSYDKVKEDSGNDYQVVDLLIQKTTQNAQELGIKYDDLIELFGRDVGYISKLNETDEDFQFYAVRKKYAAKMLDIGDLVQPETTVTVYVYIKQYLSNQMQSQAYIKAANDLIKALNTPTNVERKKTGKDLDKLLSWEK